MARRSHFLPATLALAVALLSAGWAPRAHAQVNWVDATGFWEDPANWSSNPLLPGSGDNVFINVAGVQTITHSTDPHTVNSLTIGSLANPNNNLAVTGGSLTVAGAYSNTGDTSIGGGSLILGGASSLNTFTQTFGSLGGTGTVTIAGAATITFGDMRGPGTTILNGPTSLSSSGLWLDSGRTLQNNATFTWTGGSLDLNNNINGVSLPGTGAITNTAAGLFLVQGDFSTSLFASNYGGTDTGESATFTNAGTFRKTGSSAGNQTFVSTIFNNTGTVDVQTGILSLAGGGTHTGSFATAADAILDFSGGIHNLNNASAVSSLGTLRISNGTVNTTGALTSGGLLDLTNGILNAGGNITTASYAQSFGSVQGPGNLTVQGAATITFGDMRGPGTTILNGPTSLSSSGLWLDSGRTLQNNATFTWTGGSLDLNNNINGVSLPGTGAITNTAAGLFLVQGDFSTSLFASNYGGTDTGESATFTNAGTFRKTGSSAGNQTFVSTIFNNTGTVDVQTGILSLAGGGTHTGSFATAADAILDFSGGIHNLNNASAVSSLGTLRISNGTVNTTGALTSGGLLDLTNGILNAGGNITTASYAQSFGSVQGPGNLTVQGAATITFGDMRGPGTTILNGPTSLSSSGLWLDSGRTLQNNATFTWTGGSLDLNNNINGVSLPGTGAITNTAAGLFLVQGDFSTSLFASNYGGTDTGESATFTNAGTFRKTGSSAGNQTFVSTIFNNSGTVDVQTGTLAFTQGVQGSGALQIAPAGNLRLDAPSTTGNLIHNGLAATSLELGANNLTVSTDYSNTSFGTGNSFNRRANVGGTGQILAGGDAAQAITGVNVAGGTTASPTLTIGNVRVGATTLNYQVANTGTTGPAIRGALQTTVNGGNITDARLSGTGVTAGNFGPIAPGAISGNLAVTFNAASAGPLTPLSGQVVHILNNFDNLTAQSLTITTGAGAAAFQVAQPTLASSTINLGNVRLGSTTTQALGLTNTSMAPAPFQESLNASFSGSTGAATTSGSITQLAQGATNNTSLLIGLNTSTVGPKTGTATLGLQSDGTGTSNLGTLGLPSQTVNVSGTVFRLAEANSIAPVNFGNVLVGSPQTRTVTVSNAAAGDGFSEALNAAFGALGGTNPGSFSAAGSILQLAAGATNNTSMIVTLNTGAAGSVSATVQVLLASDGAGTSNLGITPLPTQTIGLSGLITGVVGNLAQAGAATPNPVTFTPRRVGETATQTLSIANIAGAPAEGLNGSIGTASPGITAGGSFTGLAPGATNNTSLVVGLNTATAGAKSGTATIALSSDGTFNSGVPTALPSQTVNVSGNVFQIAQPTLTSSTINLGSLHVASTATQPLGLTNTSAAPAGFQESLNASFSGATGAATTSGSITQLAQGATNNTSLLVGLNTSTVGPKNGTATLSLQSDGTGTSGFASLGLAPQTVTVSGTVFRLAEPNAIAPINFGNVLAGSAQTRTLTVSNLAAMDGFSEALNAAFGTLGGTNAGSFSTSGSVLQLPPGATNNSSMVVTLNTSAAGSVSATVQVLLASDGAGSSNLGVTSLPTQTVGLSGLITGVVGNLAQAGPATPNPVSFGNRRVGDTATQVLSIANLATAPAEGLNGSIGTASSGITATGSFTSLAPGATNNSSLVVGLNTATAGAKSGTATIALSSDGTFNSGVQTALASQTVDVSGNVFRLASPTLNTGSVSLAARVGDASPTTTLSVTNASPDAFTEGLKASFGATPSSFTGSGVIANLAAAQTDATSMRVGLVTGTPGTFGGTATVDFTSTGVGTTGASDVSVGSANVTVNGKVYTPAAAQLQTTSVNFGIVHKGDSVLPAALTVGNVAPVTALNDVLVGGFGTVSSPFTTSGTLPGVAPGATNNTGLKVGLNTANAGVFSGSASVNFASRNPDLPDLALAPGTVSLAGQVNNFAKTDVAFFAGSGTLSRNLTAFTLDFGSILQAPDLLTTRLTILNNIPGLEPGDLLDVDFLTNAPAFGLTGFDSQRDIVAGGFFGVFISFDPSMPLGNYVGDILIHSFGHNASGFREPLPDITLTLHANIAADLEPVPEPATLVLFALGTALAFGTRLYRRSTPR